MEFKVKCHRLQNKVHYLKRKQLLEKKGVEASGKLKQLKQDNINLQRTNAILNAEIQGTSDINTKDGKRYSDDMRVCVMDLAGMDIATNKIPEIIKSVGRNIFHNAVETPCKTTVQKISDEGHVISKKHIGEKVCEASNWGVFSDGTTRDGKKIVNVGVNIGKGSYSLGYSSVAREDAATVSGVIRDTIYETAELTERVSCDLLKNLSTFMSDRAAVMKRTNIILDEWRKHELSQVLEPNEIHNVEFLYCAAHVLLGFHNKIDQKLREQEKINCPTGRDTNVKFNKFKNTEPAVLRTIRTGSDVLGPRGDEKNGVREQWLAYMRIHGKRSQIISYRSNRFDNIFIGALSFVIHHDDIIDFLGNYIDSPNLKLQSVLLDLKSDNIYHHLLALSLIGCIISNPYWNLINSEEHHLDLYKYIQPLHTKLQTWSNDPTEMIHANVLPIFHTFPHSESNTKHVCQLIEPCSTEVKAILCMLCKCLLQVIEKQLNEFLAEGKYGMEPSPEMRERTSNAKLTNIQSENLFGDLDFSIRRKRNATLHHHSSIIMLKRNNTVKWLQQKSITARKIILKCARQKAKILRNKHQVLEKDVKTERQNLIKNIRNKKLQSEQKKMNELRRIENSIRKMGGIVKSLTALNSLLSHKESLVKKKAKIRDQLLYLKHFDNQHVESKSMSCSQSLKNLKKYLIEILQLEQIKTITIGTWVVVAYQDTWYPGEVKEVNDKQFSVNFMHPKKLNNNTFIWPQKSDVKDVEKHFIIFSHFDVIPTPGLRFYVIPEFEDIVDLYEKYRVKYF